MQKFYWKGPTGESHQAHGHHDGGGGGLYDYPRYHRVHQPAQTKDRRVSRDDCSSSTVSVFNNTGDHSEFYEHTTATKQEHRERVSKPGSGGGEYYERAGSQVGSDYYDVSKKQQQGHNGSEYYAPLRLPVNCSPSEVELRTTSHSVKVRPGSSCAGASVRVTSPVREEERRSDEVEGGRGAHKVLLRLRQERRNDEKPTRREKNRTWGQATLQKGRERGAIKDLDYGHNYENVYDDDDDDEGIERGRRHSEKGRAALYRSKSCDRAGVRGAVRDQVRNLSERLSSLGGETPASSRASCVTPTPSILQSFASRTIPCVELRRDLTCARGQGGRASPACSEEEYTAAAGTQVSRPAQSLAYRMRGKLESVNKKMHMIRSRSAERLRGGLRQGAPVIQVAPTGQRSRPPAEEPATTYNGPFIGQARAVVDYLPSPYDRDALRFSKDDIIDIIAMNASGLWRGACAGRVGNFKFVNVEILPPRERRRSRSRSLRRVKRRPRTIAEVMRVLNMDDHLPVFVLNGYENLTLFKDMDDPELDYLGIVDPSQREKLLGMAELLFPSPGEEKVDSKVEAEEEEDLEETRWSSRRSKESESEDSGESEESGIGETGSDGSSLGREPEMEGRGRSRRVCR